MTRFFLGVDVGGTKTHALIATEMGQVIALGEAGPGNYEGVGFDGLAAAMREATFKALAQARISVEQIAGAGFGVGGYDWPSERQPTLEAIGKLGLRAPLELVNDAIIGLIVGASQGWGVVVVAGTGTNCRGLDRKGREGRVTGRGLDFGEAGGASELTARVQQVIAHEWTKRGPATRLTPAMIELVGARDLDDLMEGLALRRYHLNASAAPLVFQIAAEGDRVAQEVIAWAGHELGEMAISVIRQLEFESLEFDVVLIGSLFKGGPLLLDPMQQTILRVAPGARFVQLTAPPVIGAVMLGMQQAGTNPHVLRETLIQSTIELMRQS